MPKAGAVGWMSVAEVERALARSRDFLVMSGLDRRVDETGTAVDPYDRSAPIGRGESAGDECGTATRS